MARQASEKEGLYEITDHTTATDWERFTANLEEILSDWGLCKQSESSQPYHQLPQGHISHGLWHEKRDTLKFGNFVFDIRYQYLDDSNLRSSDREQNQYDHEENNQNQNQLKDLSTSSSPDYHDADDEDGTTPAATARDIPQGKAEQEDDKDEPNKIPECLLDMQATSNDFASKAHCLVRWYNLRKFMILIPRSDPIAEEGQLKIVLSSASMALSSTGCHVPIFVQVRNPESNFFQGVSEYFNIRTMYEMIYFRSNLEQYSYLSELISLFREKTSCNLNHPISATVRLNYCLDFFDLFVDPQDEFAGNEHSDNDDQDELVKMTANRKKVQPKALPRQDMRTGATFEQVKETLDKCLPHPYRILRFLHVAAIWPPTSDKMITDSRVHSDLNPIEAPIWTIRSVTSDNCNMKLVHETQAVYKLLESAVDYAYDKLDASQVFADSGREIIKAQCLKLSYDLAIQPEVVLSTSPSDNIRKLIALLFYRLYELKEDLDGLDQIARQLKKRPSLSEIYHEFRKLKPSVKEFIIRTQMARPYNENSPNLPQWMFCTICDKELRLAGAFSELCH